MRNASIILTLIAFTVPLCSVCDILKISFETLMEICDMSKTKISETQDLSKHLLSI